METNYVLLGPECEHKSPGRRQYADSDLEGLEWVRPEVSHSRHPGDAAAAGQDTILSSSIVYFFPLQLVTG